MAVSVMLNGCAPRAMGASSRPQGADDGMGYRDWTGYIGFLGVERLPRENSRAAMPR